MKRFIDNSNISKNSSAPSLSYLNEYQSSESDIDEEREVKSTKKGILVKKSRWDPGKNKMDNDDIPGSTSFVKKDFKYDYIRIISDDRYLPFLKHLKKPGVSVLPYPNLKMEEFENYLLKENEHSSRSTLFLLVIGIHSVTKTVQANFCYASGCKKPLQALNSINNFEKFNIKYVRMLQSLIESCKKSLPSKSNIAILPALPISLHSNFGTHQVLHLKQTQFPHYVFENKGNSISKWYTTWMDSISKLSHSSFLEFGDKILSMFDKFNDEQYKQVKLMTCKRGLDKPTYNIWKKVVEEVVDVALKDSITRSVANERVLTENATTTSNVSKCNYSKTIDNEIISIQSLNVQENLKNMVMCDHLVFIGHADSLELLPDIGFCSYSQWYFDDIIESTNLSIKISSLSSRDFKRILFIIISDVSMIGNDEKNSECILKNCKELISYVKAPNTYVSMLENLKNNLQSVRKAIFDIRKLCTFQSKVILAPFTPRVFILISSIIFHTKMHANKKDHISARFLRGSTKKMWDDILNKFEEEWNKLVLELLHESTDKILHVKNIILAYTESIKCSTTWKELTVDIPDTNCSAISSWKSCIIVLAMKAWGEPLDSSHLTESKENIEVPSTISEFDIKKEILQPQDFKTEDLYSEVNEFDIKNTVKIDSGLTSEKSDINRSNSYREIDEILSFATNIVNCHKVSNVKESAKIMFNHVFIVGSSELINPLLECNISSTMIYHNFVNFEDSEIQHLLYQMGSSQGNVCCLVFDISLITIKLMSSGCIKHSCQQPLYVNALKIDYSKAEAELEMLISTQLQNISNFIRKLSEYIPVLVLPLSPERLYCDDEETQPWHHQISHSICNFGSQVIYGSRALWNRAIQLLIYSWNNLMKFVNCNYDSKHYISSYISSNPSTFIIFNKAVDFTINWMEPEIWKAFSEIFLQSLISTNDLYSNSEMIRSIPCSDKICVTVFKISPFVPANFFQEFFNMADQNVVIKSDRDKYILNGISFGKANLLAQKLNEYQVAVAVLHASSYIGNDYFEFGLMEKICILARLEKVYNKWKPEIIKNVASKINEVPNILTLKSVSCKKKGCNPVSCPFYHGPNDKRRNPLIYKYSNFLCSQKKLYCTAGLQCEDSHNSYEIAFHPLYYQLLPCTKTYRKNPELCNAQAPCNLAHAETPERFFTPTWEDLIVIGLQNSLRFFTGAIRTSAKVEEVKRSKLKVLLMSPSSEFLDITMKASSELIKSFGLIVGTETGGNLSSPDSFQVYAGNPIAFANLDPNILTDMIGCIIVDDIQRILDNEVSMKCMLQFFIVIKQFTDYSSSVLNKVFISSSPDSRIKSIIDDVACSMPLKEVTSSNDIYKVDLPVEGIVPEVSALEIPSGKLPKCPSPPSIKVKSTTDLTSKDRPEKLVTYSDDEDKDDHKDKKSRSSKKGSRNSGLISKKKRSRSRSVERRGSRRRSRSRSYSRSKSSKVTRNKDTKRKKRERDYDSSSEKEQLSNKYGLPSTRKNHLSVFSTTLRVSSLSLKAGREELTELFEPIGDIVSMDIIGREAIICMKRRRDAARALDELQCYNLKARPINLAWTIDQRVARKFFREYWTKSEGCSYIPYNDLYLINSSDLDLIQKYNLIDEETLPSYFKGIDPGRSFSSILKNRKLKDDDRKELKKKVTKKKYETDSSEEDDSDVEITKVTGGTQKLTEKERIRLIEGLPPHKENHLCVCSTTLWVGHLPKIFDQNELTESFKEYGEIVSVNHIPPRRCAIICMSRRKDAARAFRKLKNLKLQRQTVSITWASGEGAKHEDLKNYWDEELGCSYIPYDVLPALKPFCLSSLEDGGEIIGETIPSITGLNAKNPSIIKKQVNLSRRLSPPPPPSIKLKPISEDVSSRSAIFDSNLSKLKPLESSTSKIIRSKLAERLESEEDWHRRQQSKPSKVPQPQVSHSAEKPTISIPQAYPVLEPEEDWRRRQQPEPSKVPRPQVSHSAEKLPISIHQAYPVLDTQVDLSTRLGKKLYEEYTIELERKRHSFENDFMVYFNVPELYPNYQIHFDSFTAMYVVQHKGKTAQHKERLWKLYWKSVFEDIKNEEWEKVEKSLIEEMENKISKPIAPLQSSSLVKEATEAHISLPMSKDKHSLAHREVEMPFEITPQYSTPCDDLQERFSSYNLGAGSSSHGAYEELVDNSRISSMLPIEDTNTSPLEIDSGPYSFAEMIYLIDHLSEDIGFLGPSVKAMVESSKEYGITSKESYMVFTESENVMLLNMMLEKLKLLCISGSSSNHHLYERAIDWIPIFLEDAKNGPTDKALPEIDVLKIDLEALGRASLGKEPKYALQLIKTALSYEGIHDPPKEYVNQLFLKVCAVHFALSMED